MTATHQMKTTATKQPTPMRNALLIAAFVLAVSVHADDDDLDQRCTCTAAQRDWYRHHPHHNRFFGNVEPCCDGGFTCHCQDRVVSFRLSRTCAHDEQRIFQRLAGQAHCCADSEGELTVAAKKKQEAKQQSQPFESEIREGCCSRPKKPRRCGLRRCGDCSWQAKDR